MANVLVTGGAGYVGSVCCAELLRRGHSVTVIDDLSTGFRDAAPTGATFFQLDLADRSALQSLLKKNRFDVVFHFAAKALVAESVSDPGVFFQRNVASSITMLEALREAQIRNFVFSSSAAVYGIPEKTPIDEDDPKNPVNSYGETKLMLERALDWYARAYGWSVIALRYFNAAGATAELGERHQPETHIIPLLLEAAAGERKVFSIYGGDYPTPDGTCLRDYVHVLDIASAHIGALDRMNQPGMRAYNIGLGESYSVQAVCRAVEKVVGHPVPTHMEKRRPGDPAVLCASPARIMREMGWKPQHSSLEEIISSAWQWKRRR
ncbi:MAG TPA: UDP-glucose 4-epimerase GalE [Candidatus Angelobacter sp.]